MQGAAKLPFSPSPSDANGSGYIHVMADISL